MKRYSGDGTCVCPYLKIGHCLYIFVLKDPFSRTCSDRIVAAKVGILFMQRKKKKGHCETNIFLELVAKPILGIWMKIIDHDRNKQEKYWFDVKVWLNREAIVRFKTGGVSFWVVLYGERESNAKLYESFEPFYPFPSKNKVKKIKKKKGKDIMTANGAYITH